MTKRRSSIVGTAALIAVLLAVAPAAHAGGGGGTEVGAGGTCRAQSEWKLKLKPDDGRLEVEFEVDSNVSGQSWNVRIKQNGSRIFSGTRVTHGASGSFTVHRRPGDQAGTDRFLARATSPSTGETCVARAHI